MLLDFVKHCRKKNARWSGTTDFSIRRRDASGGRASRGMTGDITSGEAAHKKGSGNLDRDTNVGTILIT